MEKFDIGSLGVEAAARRVAETLRAPDGVAVVPTETVYGIVSRVTEAGAKRIFALKNRLESKKLGWFVGDWRQLARHGVRLTPQVCRLAERYLPGALTIIAPTADGGSVGFRVPDHPFLQALLAEMGEPLLQTSANLSGEPDSRSLAVALAGLEGEVDAAADGGILPPETLASTVVDLRGAEPRILRQGILKVDLNDL